MTTPLTRARVRKLLAQQRCPVCGSAREIRSGDGKGPHALVVFGCSASFIVDGNGAINVCNVCPSGSRLAVAALNQEAYDEVVPESGPVCHTFEPATLSHAATCAHCGYRESDPVHRKAGAA